MQVSVHDVHALPESMSNPQVDCSVSHQLVRREAGAYPAIGLNVFERPNPVDHPDNTGSAQRKSVRAPDEHVLAG